MLKLAVTGACGRMGQRLVALGRESGDFQIAAALESEDHPMLGRDIGAIAGIGDIGVTVGHELAETPDVMVDFSVPESTVCWAKVCTDNETAMVVGTTGLNKQQTHVIEQAAKKIPIVFAANMSLGVNLLFKLAGEVAKVLDDSYDVEIAETHHRFKRDAPSGTAMELARRVAESKGWPMPDCLVHGRSGPNALRQSGTIGMHALRAGDTVGKHSVVFSTLGETVELHHTAQSRDTFVRGALQAAKWVARQKPALYDMFDVLGLNAPST